MVFQAIQAPKRRAWKATNLRLPPKPPMRSATRSACVRSRVNSCSSLRTASMFSRIALPVFAGAAMLSQLRMPKPVDLLFSFRSVIHARALFGAGAVALREDVCKLGAHEDNLRG